MGNMTPDEELVWHYTDAAGLKGIIENNVLWAGQLSHMNDADEIEYGRQILELSIRGLEEEHGDTVTTKALRILGESREQSESLTQSTFSLSASRNPDNLSLWRNYGGSASYALGLSRQQELVPFVSEEDVNEFGRKPMESKDGFWDTFNRVVKPAQNLSRGWIDVTYARELVVVEPRSRQLLDACKPGEDSEVFQFASAVSMFETLGTIKNPTFSAEEEIRQLFNVKPPLAFLKFRPTRRGLNPYIEITSKPDNWNTFELGITGVATRTSKLPIQSICISPHGHVPQAVQTLKVFLERHGYANVKIVKSVSSFRG